MVYCSYLWIVSFFLFFCLLGISKIRLNFLGVLMYIEGISIAVLMSLLAMKSGIICVIYLVFVICETAWGIGMLVKLIRMKGNDLVRSFSFTVC